MIRVNTNGAVRKIQAAMRNLEERRRAEVALADKYLEIIKERTPVGKTTCGERVVPSGATRKSWTLHVLQNDVHGVRWTINADGREDIVLYLEWGTPDHIISAKPGGALSFEWPKMGGGEFAFKHVHHPGTKPLGFVRLTQAQLDAETDRLTEEMHAKNRALNH